MNLEISSKENPHFKTLKKIIKEKNDYIVIEGKKLLEEAIQSSVKIEKIYIGRLNDQTIPNLFSGYKKSELIFVKNDLLASVFSTDSKPKDKNLILALAKQPSWQLKDFFKTKTPLIFVEHIQDPGNLGTIIRSALAFNAGGVLLSENSVNPFNTKVVRASAGAIFKLPVLIISDFNDVIRFAKKESFKIIATSSRANKSLHEINTKSPCVFLFGNEGKGLSKTLLDYADETVMISQSHEVESLNLGVAASIVLWELYKKNK